MKSPASFQVWQLCRYCKGQAFQTSILAVASIMKLPTIIINIELPTTKALLRKTVDTAKSIMIKVTIGNNVERKTKILDENTTLLQAIEDAEIDYSRCTMNLDGFSLKSGDLDKIFADLGITEKFYLLNVVKADNA